MCFVKPLKVREVMENKVVLENGLKAYYEKNIMLKKNDIVLVYGNVVISRIAKKNK